MTRKTINTPIIDRALINREYVATVITGGKIEAYTEYVAQAAFANKVHTDDIEATIARYVGGYAVTDHSNITYAEVLGNLKATL